MTPRETSWRLRLREIGDDGEPGGVLGTGFAVTDHAALTCAHVVGEATECWVESLDGSVRGQRCTIQSKPEAIDMADGPSDVAVIGIPNPVIAAPLAFFNPLPPAPRLKSLDTSTDTLAWSGRRSLAA